MVDYSKPITDGDIKKAKTWYDIVCWGGLLIVLLPVGIANLILGYLMGDSPCTLCWGQREQMAFIGVVALFILKTVESTLSQIRRRRARGTSGLWPSSP